MKFWINTISLQHVEVGMKGGFTQANHGKVANLRRLNRGDLIVFYSPRKEFRSGEPLQRFTALGRVVDDEPYQVEMSPDFHPWRRRVDYLPAQEAPIRPLVDQLDFIEDKQRWGYPFRRGLFEIGAQDFKRITTAMQAKIAI